MNRLCRIHKTPLVMDAAGVQGACLQCRREVDREQPRVPAAQKLLREIETTQGVQVTH